MRFQHFYQAWINAGDPGPFEFYFFWTKYHIVCISTTIIILISKYNFFTFNAFLVILNCEITIVKYCDSNHRLIKILFTSKLQLVWQIEMCHTNICWQTFNLNHHVRPDHTPVYITCLSGNKCFVNHVWSSQIVR